MSYSYGIFPRIKIHPNGMEAHNSYLGVSVDPHYPYFGAAVAEERAEFAFKWKRLAPLALVLSAIVFYFYWPLFPLGILAAALFLRALPGFNREVERVGQSVWCSTASQCYGIPIDVTLDECAKNLTSDSHYYPYFQGYDRELLRAELVQHLKAANKWVFNHLPTITKDIKRNA